MSKKKKVETPVRVIKNKAKGDGHNRETRVFAREIHETYCDDKKCKFYGGPAQQGVCYSDKPSILNWDRIAKQEAQHAEELAYIKKKYKGKQYVRWLEAHYECAMMNWTFTLDDLVRLRRDVALLKLELKSRGKR